MNFQTYTVLTKSEKKYCLSKLMFDCESSHPLISEKLANDLKLNMTQNENLSVYSDKVQYLLSVYSVMKCPIN